LHVFIFFSLFKYEKNLFSKNSFAVLLKKLRVKKNLYSKNSFAVLLKKLRVKKNLYSKNSFAVLLKKFTNSRKMMVVSNTKFLQKIEARQRVLYGGLYCVEIANQKFYYPEELDFVLDLTRGTIEMAQPHYSDYMTMYLSAAFKELDLIPVNTLESYNYALNHIQRFGGFNYPELVTWDFAQVMFEDRLDILKSLGCDPLHVNCPEMAVLLTQYRVEVDPNYLRKCELLSCFPEEVLRVHTDLVMKCVFVATGGSISCFVEGIDLVEFLGLLSYYKIYLVKIGYLSANAVIPAAGAVLAAADPVSVAAGVDQGIVAAANYVPAGFVPTADFVSPVDPVPSVDSVPLPTVELDTTTDAGSNDTGSPKKPGFPFYSCIFGVLLMGALIKTIFF
jgi:hypothetical protein